MLNIEMKVYFNINGCTHSVQNLNRLVLVLVINRRLMDNTKLISSDTESV